MTSLNLERLSFQEELSFENDQHLATILSKEQFLSLKGLFINDNLISSYEEYYSLIEPTLKKNKLLNICIL